MTKTIIISLSGKKPEEEIKTTKSEVQVEIKGDNLHITGIQDCDYLEYAARDVNTQSRFYILHAHKTIGYPSIRLHIGLENELVEAKVTNVERFRDGGTTNITYILADRKGELFFPSPLKKDLNPTDNYIGKRVNQLELFKLPK